MTAIASNKVEAQLSTEQFATKYFLENAPPDAEVSKILPNARDVVVARVRLIGAISTLGSPYRAPPPPKDLYGASLEIIEVLRGAVAAGARHEVVFGVAGTGQRYQYPLPARSNSKPYFIVSYLDADGIRRLVGFPVGQQEHETWVSERIAICAAQFSRFVEELDALMTINPRAVDPFLALLNQHFPVMGCDIPTVVDIARKSSFFGSAYEGPSSWGVLFANGEQGKSGFTAGVAFQKSNGDSRLPYAHVNRL